MHSHILDPPPHPPPPSSLAPARTPGTNKGRHYLGNLTLHNVGRKLDQPPAPLFFITNPSPSALYASVIIHARLDGSPKLA